MTLDDLKAMLSTAPGADHHARIAHVLRTITKDGRTAVAALGALGPWALAALEREMGRRRENPHGEIAVAGCPGLRKNAWAWQRADIVRAQAWFSAQARALGDISAMLAKVATYFQNDRETMKQVKPRMPITLRAQFAAWAERPRKDKLAA